MKKILLTIFGVLFVLSGSVWFLQGISVLPGSLMSGQTQWAIYGAVALIIGIVMFVFAYWRKPTPPK